MIDFNPGSKNMLQIEKLLEEYVFEKGVCSMSGSIYDTAWVSLVSKSVGGVQTWLSPSSFRCICDAQAESGGWEGGCAVDEIVNTLACLLSLKRHEKVDRDEVFGLAERIEKATQFVAQRLSAWDISSTERVAFELLVPSTLDLLEAEGVYLNFPQSDALRQLKQIKMSKIQLSHLYKYPSTILHSLESLIGTIDFDKMSHHLREGSMMASPSSTAAYLMNVSTWDEKAEKYLCDALENGRRIKPGMVTNVYPIGTFEFAWSTCNILEAGLEIDTVYREKLRDVLSGYLERGNGLTGFDPSVIPDSDDTAKTITALHLLGYSAPLDPLIKTFEVDGHFQCFQFERNPSFSANCNVLMAFLSAPDPSKYLSQINKCALYICHAWWNSEGPLKDKWNLSPYYPTMLASQGLIRLLHLYDNNILQLSEDFLQVKVMVVLFQILSRVLRQQNEKGSWGTLGSREETAYAIITLANCCSLPFASPIAEQIKTAISKAQEFLRTTSALEDVTLSFNDYIWAGKVSYGVETVCHSYILAALNTPVPQFELGPRVTALVHIPWKRFNSFSKFYATLPMFAKVESWKLKAWLIEGYLYLPDLKKMRLSVFKREEVGEDKYFEYLPFSWIAPNGLENADTSAQLLFDMMVISMVNYQVDEYFDSVVARGNCFTISQLRMNIEKLFSGLKIEATENAVNEVEGLRDKDRDICHQLEKFLRFIVTHPRIQNAGANDKAHLQLELKSYLLAHTQQCEDNIKLRLYRQKTYGSPPSSYIRWVRNTASDHLSSHYSFAFFVCLLSRDNDYFPTSQIRYIVQDCCMHFTTICRMFNDYGSLERDLKESNLNSMFFPEFNGERKSDIELRKELACLADYERQCLALSFDKLKMVCGQHHHRIFEMVRLFNNASEIYTEVYEVKDVSASCNS